MHSSFVRIKDKNPTLSNSGVYKLTCTTCKNSSTTPTIYIGRTSRAITTRLKEHIRALRYNNYPIDPVSVKSTFALHLLEHLHDFNAEEDCQIIYSTNNFFKSILVESFEIQAAIRNNHLNCINDSTPWEPQNILNNFLYDPRNPT